MNFVLEGDGVEYEASVTKDEEWTVTVEGIPSLEDGQYTVKLKEPDSPQEDYNDPDNWNLSVSVEESVYEVEMKYLGVVGRSVNHTMKVDWTDVEEELRESFNIEILCGKEVASEPCSGNTDTLIPIKVEDDSVGEQYTLLKYHLFDGDVDQVEPVYGYRPKGVPEGLNVEVTHDSGVTYQTTITKKDVEEPDEGEQEG